MHAQSLVTAWQNGHKSDVLDTVEKAHPYLAAQIMSIFGDAPEAFEFALKLQRRWIDTIGSDDRIEQCIDPCCAD